MADAAPPKYSTVVDNKDVDEQGNTITPDSMSGKGVDILGAQGTDPVLAKKMHLVNNAIDEIGLTPYHWKLFVLNGFGYAADSLMLLVQSVVATTAIYEFKPTFTTGLTVAVYVGMLVGALFWGFSADIIGRKYAFNISLLLSAVFCIVAGAAPNWEVLGLFVCLSAFGSGGNLVLDTAVFLEYLPSSKQWLVTLMASWWGVGQLVTGLFAWAFLPRYSCASATDVCNWQTNPGWRYVWFASGSLVLVMAILRIIVIRLNETPKFLVGEGKDVEVVKSLQYVATKYNRPCSLTVEQLTACGQLAQQPSGTSRGAAQLKHLTGLFATRQMTLSTSLIWFSWALIGLAYPLFYVFLPNYLSRLPDISVDESWRNYAIGNVASIPSPILAAYMCNSKWFWGRRGTMIIGSLTTMVFMFVYTQVETQAQNLGITCAIAFCLVSPLRFLFFSPSPRRFSFVLHDSMLSRQRERYKMSFLEQRNQQHALNKRFSTRRGDEIEKMSGWWAYHCAFATKERKESFDAFCLSEQGALLRHTICANGNNRYSSHIEALK
jgi:MFS family permease